MSDDIKSKVDYVLANKSNPTMHHCHWPGCERAVPPSMWGCRQHWFALPKHFRDRIWATFIPGQEVSKTPSESYIQVAIEIREWVKANYK